MQRTVLFLLLLPVVVSFSPPFGLPGTMRYVNDSGDVLELSPGRGKTRCVYLELQESEDGCRERLSGRTEKITHKRYSFRMETDTLYLKVTERKVKITGVSKGCGDFEGTYRRKELE